MSQKILFLSSNPTDTEPLRLDKEAREIAESLSRSNDRDQFSLIKISAARIEDLRRSLLDHSPKIVHFAGHGGGNDGIVLEDSDGQARQVPNDALADLFGFCSDHLECVILNACYSDVQAAQICEDIPYVVGMSADISDDAAIEFTVAFYDALGAGKSVEVAYQFGCNAIALKDLPENLTPVLNIKELSAAEKLRLMLGRSPASDVVADVSIFDNGLGSWNRGDDTVVRYSVIKDDGRIRISHQLNYLDLFDAGGPIAPMSYLSSTRCPFQWDFPTLDFKVLNNSPKTLFLTEIIFDIVESRPDLRPLLAIKRDVQQRYAGELLLVNEGWCDIVDLAISFNLLPGEIPESIVPDPPYRHSIVLPLLSDQAQIDITQAFKQEGVDIEGLMLLSTGEWRDEETFVISTADGSSEKISPIELEAREKQYLNRFSDYAGTLVGEISFASASAPRELRSVKFRGVVYLANANRVGLPRPPTATYGTIFEAEADSYQRRVQISHELQPGETDRFTVKVAVRKSSVHIFRATILDITGQELQLPPILLECFVPRSRRTSIELRLDAPSQ